MLRDKLFVLKSEFQDTSMPQRNFHCSDCTAISGLLAAFPSLASRLDIERVDFQRPRPAIVDLIGEANQNAPVLVLAHDAPDHLATGDHNGQKFVSGLGEIYRVLHLRHGFPEEHLEDEGPLGAD